MSLKSLGMPNYLHSPEFKTYIFEFVSSLRKGERHAFRFWCIGLIPRAKLDIDVADGPDDGDIYRWIECLQDDNKLSFSDMYLLKRFLLAIKRVDLLEKLKVIELCIAIGIILETYGKVIASGGSDVCSACDLSLYTDIVEFLVFTGEENQELISRALEQLKQVDGDSEVFALMDSVIQECQQSPWSSVTTLLVTMGKFYQSRNSDSEKEAYVIAKFNKILAEWMLKLGGLVSDNMSGMSV